MRTLAPRLAAVLVVLALGAGLVAMAAPAPADDQVLTELTPFRPFKLHNKIVHGASFLDAARRHWFYVSRFGPEVGFDGNYHVWLFDPDRLQQVGQELIL